MLPLVEVGDLDVNATSMGLPETVAVANKNVDDDAGEVNDVTTALLADAATDLLVLSLLLSHPLLTIYWTLSLIKLSKNCQRGSKPGCEVGWLGN